MFSNKVTQKKYFSFSNLSELQLVFASLIGDAPYQKLIAQQNSIVPTLNPQTTYLVLAYALSHRAKYVFSTYGH